MINLNFGQIKNPMTNKKIYISFCLEIKFGLVKYKYLKTYNCVCS